MSAVLLQPAATDRPETADSWVDCCAMRASLKASVDELIFPWIAKQWQLVQVLGQSVFPSPV